MGMHTSADPSDKIISSLASRIHGVNDLSRYTKEDQLGLILSVKHVLKHSSPPAMVSHLYTDDNGSDPSALSTRSNELLTKIINIDNIKIQNDISKAIMIIGENWTFDNSSDLKDEVIIGRNCDSISEETIQQQRDLLQSGQLPVDIDLGPHKVVSRKHIILNRDPEDMKWYLTVYGRNTGKLDFKRISSKQLGEKIGPLRSGTILDVGNTQMMLIFENEALPILSLPSYYKLIPRLVTMYGLNGNNNKLLRDIINSSTYVRKQNISIDQQDDEDDVFIGKIRNDPETNPTDTQNEHHSSLSTKNSSNNNNNNNAVNADMTLDLGNQSPVKSPVRSPNNSGSKTNIGNSGYSNSNNNNNSSIETDKNNSLSNDLVLSNIPIISSRQRNDQETEDIPSSKKRRVETDINGKTSVSSPPMITPVSTSTSTSASALVPAPVSIASHSPSSSYDNIKRRVAELPSSVPAPNFYSSSSSSSSSTTNPSSNQAHSPFSLPKQPSSINTTTSDQLLSSSSSSSSSGAVITAANIGKSNISRTNNTSTTTSGKIKRPPWKYTTLITKAILSSPEGCLPLSKIYDYISNLHPFYDKSVTSWQNSVRHNLSVHPTFVKTVNSLNSSSWKISDDTRDEFLVNWYQGSIGKMKVNGNAIIKEFCLFMSKYSDRFPGQKEPEYYRNLKIEKK